MKHYNIYITGKVQGVFFRDSTKAVADQLRVRGFVMNKPDGSVYIEAECDDLTKDSFLEWCAEGPNRAEVENVRVEEGELQSFINFIVKR